MIKYLMYKKRLFIYTAVSAAAAFAVVLISGMMSAGAVCKAAVYFWLLIHLSRAVDDLSDFDKDGRNIISKKTLAVYTAALIILFVGSSTVLYGLRGLLSAGVAGYLFLMEKFDILTILSVLAGCGCWFFMSGGMECFASIPVIVFLAFTILSETVFYVYKRSKRK